MSRQSRSSLGPANPGREPVGAGGRPGWVVALFLAAAVYDGVLGLAFLFAPQRVFHAFHVTPPNHYGYVQFPAALLIVFAALFLAIARSPHTNRNLIPFGMLLKVSYCSVVFVYWVGTGIPNMWKPFAIIDLFFLLLFSWAYVRLGPGSERRAVPGGP